MHIGRPWKRQGHRETIKGYIFLMLCIIGGATFSPLARQLGTVFSPLSLLLVGETSILLFLSFSFGILPLLHTLRRTGRRHAMPLFVLSFCVTMGLLFWFLGLEVTEAANAELLGKMETLFVLLLSHVILHERFSRVHGFSTALIFLGILVVFLRDMNGGFQIHSGDVLIILGGLWFSIASIITKRSLHRLPPELILFTRSTFAVLFFFLLSPFLPSPIAMEFATMTPALLPPLLGFVFLSRFLAVFSFYKAVERLPLTIVFLTLPLTTIGAVLFAHLYLGESLTWHHLVGGGCIIIGVVLLNRFHTHPSNARALAHMKQHPRQHV